MFPSGHCIQEQAMTPTPASLSGSLGVTLQINSFKEIKKQELERKLEAMFSSGHGVNREVKTDDRH